MKTILASEVPRRHDKSGLLSHNLEALTIKSALKVNPGKLGLTVKKIFM